MITRLSPRPSGCPSDITSENFLPKIGTPPRAFFLRSEHASFACSSHTAPFIKKDGFPRRLFHVGRGDMIRTCDTLVPNQVLYQAELRPALPSLTLILLFFHNCKFFLIPFSIFFLYFLFLLLYNFFIVHFFRELL